MADLPRPWVVEPDHETLWGNTISSHDEYMMTRYKVYECSNETRDRSHIWRDCYFNHPGDLYGRRNPKMVSYAPIACQKYNPKKGQYCKPYCGLAHGVMEMVLRPNFYRTNMCPNGLTCHHKPCGFAHYLDELPPVVKKWRRAALVDDHDVDDEDNSCPTLTGLLKGNYHGGEEIFPDHGDDEDNNNNNPNMNIPGVSDYHWGVGNSIWTVQDKTSCSTSLEVDGEILPAELQVHAR